MYFYGLIAFKVWMAIDCVRRGAESFWLWVILVLPFGDWVYFVMVKAQDFRGSLRFDRPRRSSLDELRRRFRATPSGQHQLALAEGLAQAGEHGEAAGHYRALLERDPDRPPLRLGLARALRGQGELEASLAAYEELLAADPRHADHAAAQECAELRGELGDRAGAIRALEALVAASDRIEHRLALAGQLAQAGEAVRARDALERALDSHEDSPDFVRRRDRAVARDARRLLRELEREPSGPGPTRSGDASSRA